MKELSLNILDIVQNSIKAKASLVGINIIEDDETLEITVSDNGCGMKADFLATVADPFSTTRTTRKVGLGIPFLKLQAEQTGGSLNITSRHESEYPETHGTETKALYYKNHIDMTPLGDIVATVVTLIQCNPHIDFNFYHKICEKEIVLDTRQMREILGDIPLNSAEVIGWVSESLSEQYK
jgi:nitrogen fixation/metabolism regulation signal transduction histidine kinase